MSALAIAIALAMATASTGLSVPLAAPATPAASKTLPPGRALFVKHGCRGCHSVRSEGIAASHRPETAIDLSGVGPQHDAAWFKKWLRRQVEARSRQSPDQIVRHAVAFAGTDRQLQQLVDWLRGLVHGT